MKFLITLPDNAFYAWQTLVQINNFRRMGYEAETHYLIGQRVDKVSEYILKLLEHKDDFKCKFHVIRDTRIDNRYHVSLKPFLVKEFIKNNSDIGSDTFFYTDPDVIFKEKINLNQFDKDNVWYLSDARSYLNSKYIKSKGEQLFIEMCEIVGIDPLLVEANDDAAGGAQWIVKNGTYELWDEIERVSTQLYVHMINTKDKYHPKDQEYPIQAWTAEMWAMLWVPWKYGFKMKVDKELDFCMATDNSERLSQVKILHNTGVNKVDNKAFCKPAFQVSPFFKQMMVSEESASYLYYQELKDTEKNLSKYLF